MKSDLELEDSAAVWFGLLERHLAEDALDKASAAVEELRRLGLDPGPQISRILGLLRLDRLKKLAQEAAIAKAFPLMPSIISELNRRGVRLAVSFQNARTGKVVRIES